MLDGIKMAARYAWGLNSFLRNTLTPDNCRRMLEEQMKSRERSFLAIVERGVYSNPRSPYLKLLRHAGVEYGDFAGLVRQHGVEGSLERLHALGIYITIDEFKRRVPISRPGLEIAVGLHDFDNPLLSRQYSSRTSGSRGSATRVIMDLDLLEHDAACTQLALEGFNVGETPIGIWREVPPVTTGMNVMLRLTKIGRRVDRWFSTSRFSMAPESLRFAFFTYYTVLASRVLFRPLPAPEYAPLEDAIEVARWLSLKQKEGRPAFFDTQASSAVRVCMAANENGLDISGTCFCIGGALYEGEGGGIITSGMPGHKPLLDG